MEDIDLLNDDDFEKQGKSYRCILNDVAYAKLSAENALILLQREKEQIEGMISGLETIQDEKVNHPGWYKGENHESLKYSFAGRLAPLTLGNIAKALRNLRNLRNYLNNEIISQIKKIQASSTPQTPAPEADTQESEGSARGKVQKELGEFSRKVPAYGQFMKYWRFSETEIENLVMADVITILDKSFRWNKNFYVLGRLCARKKISKYTRNDYAQELFNLNSNLTNENLARLNAGYKAKHHGCEYAEVESLLNK